MTMSIDNFQERRRLQQLSFTLWDIMNWQAHSSKYGCQGLTWQGRLKGHCRCHQCSRPLPPSPVSLASQGQKA